MPSLILPVPEVQRVLQSLNAGNTFHHHIPLADKLVPMLLCFQLTG